MTGEWVWQGFYGPMGAAQAAWADVHVGGVVGALVPLESGPMAVDEDAEDGMFAVQTRDNAPMARPAGMKTARPEMVARMVGA